MKKYLMVVEETGSGYLAYSPDMPGCVANGRTRGDGKTTFDAHL